MQISDPAVQICQPGGRDRTGLSATHRTTICQPQQALDVGERVPEILSLLDEPHQVDRPTRVVPEPPEVRSGSGRIPRRS